MINSKIVADSIGPNGKRITTFVLTYPRFIHSEFMTHRMFSRNASSSRAIPVKKQIQMVIDNPAIPIAFTKNQKGMQGGEALSGDEHKAAVAAWLEARDRAVEMANKLSDLEVHKQYANRILEPFAHITVVCTSTEWANFFALRCHPAAQPEIRMLAVLMWEAYELQTPTELKAGEYHLPFVSEEDKLAIAEHLRTDENFIKMSVARCARVSYLNHEGKKPTLEEDAALYDRLLGNVPIHASPAEHQACAVPSMYTKYQSGNFNGWIQYRKTLKNENITEFEGPSED